MKSGPSFSEDKMKNMSRLQFHLRQAPIAVQKINLTSVPKEWAICYRVFCLKHCEGLFHQKNLPSMGWNVYYRGGICYQKQGLSDVILTFPETLLMPVASTHGLRIQQIRVGKQTAAMAEPKLNFGLSSGATFCHWYLLLRLPIPEIGWRS